MGKFPTWYNTVICYPWYAFWLITIICLLPLYCRLVLQAADRGNPPLSSTATIRVQVVDVNDNSPAIPPMEPVVIAESKTKPHCPAHSFNDIHQDLKTVFSVSMCSCLDNFCFSVDLPAGYMVTMVTANDVDLSSTITYSFSDNSSTNSPFAIDRYTGVVTLTQALDYEEQTEYTLTVWASDSLHQTSGEVRVQVLDVNDNAPVFTQVSYQVQMIYFSVKKIYAWLQSPSQETHIRYMLLEIYEDNFWVARL